MEIKLKPADLKRKFLNICEPVDDGDTLGDLVDRYGRDAYIDVDIYFDDVNINVMLNREENDEEYNARIAELIAIEEKKLQKKRDKDYKEYLRLKELFEGKENG